MPKQTSGQMTTLENALLQALYTQTLLVAAREPSFTLENFVFFISSSDLRKAVGGERSSYRHDVLKAMEKRGLVVCRKEFKKTPNGVWFYALTQVALYDLDNKNHVKDYTVMAKKDVKTIKINGSKHFITQEND